MVTKKNWIYRIVSLFLFFKNLLHKDELKKNVLVIIVGHRTRFQIELGNKVI